MRKILREMSFKYTEDTGEVQEDIFIYIYRGKETYLLILYQREIIYEPRHFKYCVIRHKGSTFSTLLSHA